MSDFKYIFFDCMETLIDLHVLPTTREYAAWAFEGSGVEEHWEDFDAFYRYYMLSRQELRSQLPELSDYEIRMRFLHLIELSLPGLEYSRVEAVADSLRKNYWRNYKAVCYLRQDVQAALHGLGKLLKLGVVSNFMVMGGIQELLEMTGIREYFEFVVVSVEEGFIKPHPAIYGKALQLAGVMPEQVIFVGDDYINDYVKPTELGMYTVCLDRYGKHADLERRVRDFSELEALVGRIAGRT